MNFQTKHAKLMKELAMAKRPVEAPGLFVNIHHRLCRDNIQPNVHESTTWKILEVLTPTKSGAKRCRCEERTFSSKKPNVCILNSDRFEWQIFTEEEVKKVENLAMLAWRESQKRKEQIDYALELQKRKSEQLKKDHEMASKILDKCTEDEQLKVSFVHLVLADLAWMYCDACQAMACNLKIQETKSLNRAINDFKLEYDRYILSCVDCHTAKHIRDNSRQISDNEEFSKISHDAWDAIRLMYRYKFGKLEDIPYLELRICAQLGRMMIKAYYHAIDISNDILKQKMGDLPYAEQTAANPKIQTLDSFFDAFQGDFVLEYDSVMKTFVERWNDVFARVKFTWGQPKILLTENGN